MANNENLKPVRTKSEARERGRNGGKASGEVRRRKSAMRDTMNRLLTIRAEVEGVSDILRADGGESTYEELIAMVMIEKAMRGDVNAYNAIKATVGQTDKSESDLEEQKVRVSAAKARMGGGDEDETEDDGFLDALKDSVKEDWSDEDEETNI